MERIGKFLKNKYLPFLVCFLLMAMLLSTVYTGWGDEIHFVLQDGETLAGYLKTQYLTTHAKIVTDFLIMVLLSLPQGVWAILTAVLYALLAWALCFLISGKEADRSPASAWLTVVLMFVYNFLDVSGAGWYATTLNYIWPLSCGVISLIPIRNAIDGKTEQVWKYPLYFLSVIIGCAQEQMAAVVFCLYLVFAGYLLFSKKLNAVIVLQLIFSAASLAFLLSSPGNASRARSEAEFWYPLFLTFSPVQKLYLGIITTVMDLIYSDNPLVFVFIFLFPFFISRCTRSSLLKGISFLPLILTCVNNFFFGFFSKLYPMLEKIAPAMREFTIYTRNRYGVDDVHFSAVMFSIAVLYIVPILLCALFTLKNFFPDTPSENSGCCRIFCLPGICWTAALIVLAGFASRFVIGFSPTMYASGPRTFVYLHFSFIAFLVLLYDKCRSSVSSSVLFPPLGTAAVLEILRILYTGSLFN